MKNEKVKIVHSGTGSVVEAFLNRNAFDANAETTARAVLADVKLKGNRAVCSWAKRFDGTSVVSGKLLVSKAELHEARRLVDARFRSAVRESIARITVFAKASAKRNWSMRTPRGGFLGEQFLPLDRVGVYVPGGAAPLASTALMTATIARVAGVREIVACTPAGRDGKVNPYLLFALEAAGATEIYRAGGIQAVGLMAYGTETVRKVQKIVGPGGTYVTAAKRQVYGDVALDLVAGPSEIAVLADDTANVRHVAADLLSQVEHGTGHEKALLVTTSLKLAKGVQAELLTQTELLGRKEAIRRVVGRGMLICVIKSLSEGMALCNKFAPEHLELLVRDPQKWLGRVKCAGAVFVGPWSPESAGDFVAGPSHVLPTGGAAAMFSGLTTDDFRRRSSFIAFTRADLKETLPVIETFGRVEGLDAHVRSAQVRFEK